LKEISNGNSDDGACQNNSVKRPKIRNEAKEDKVKRNEDDSSKVCSKETKVDMDGNNGKGTDLIDDHDDNNVKSDIEVSVGLCGKKTGDRKHDTIHGVMDGPKAWAANDFFFDPKALASEGSFINPDQLYKKLMGKHKKIADETPLPPGTLLTKISNIEFLLEDIGNALQFLEFCRVFGKVCILCL
jgi:hypothetical protein